MLHRDPVKSSILSGIFLTEWKLGCLHTDVKHGASLVGRVNSSPFTRLKKQIKVPRQALFYKSNKGNCSVRKLTEHQKLEIKAKELFLQNDT